MGSKHTGMTIVEHNTTVVATTALMTPFWLPSLTSVSQVAATVTPILGAIWLTIQIVTKTSEWLRKRNEDK
jgi:hypothetical protein